MKHHRRLFRPFYHPWAGLAALTLLLLMAMVASMRVGALELSLPQILGVLSDGEPRIHYRILWDIRLPRILLGAMVGGALAVSGALLQSVLHNPLASPGIIGVSAGSGLAGVVILLLFPALSMLFVPAAFAGALLAAALVYLLAWRGNISPVRLILAGVALSALLGALTSAIMIFHAERAAGILDFMIGSLSARGWVQIHLIQYYLLFGLPAALTLGYQLNVLALGDDMASALGLHVERVRLTAIALAALLAAAAVSVAGLLGFVGLIAPHTVRMLLGPDHRFLLPGSMLFGAFLVVAGDAAGRVAMAPAELPAGVIMALLGAPFFLWLLRRRTYES